MGYPWSRQRMRLWQGLPPPSRTAFSFVCLIPASTSGTPSLLAASSLALACGLRASAPTGPVIQMSTAPTSQVLVAGGVPSSMRPCAFGHRALDSAPPYPTPPHPTFTPLQNPPTYIPHTRNPGLSLHTHAPTPDFPPVTLSA